MPDTWQRAKIVADHMTRYMSFIVDKIQEIEVFVLNQLRSGRSLQQRHLPGNPCHRDLASAATPKPGNREVYGYCFWGMNAYVSQITLWLLQICNRI